MALQFVSGVPHVVVGRIVEIESATAATVATWVRFDDIDADAAVAVRGAAFDSSAAWALYRDDVAHVSGRNNTLAGHVNTDIGRLRFESAANALNDTSWHHVAMVFEANTSSGLRMYIDGVLDPYSVSTIGHSNLVADSTDVYLGFNSASVQLLGAMADFAIWNEALESAQIANLAAGFSPLMLPVFDRLVVHCDLIRGLNRPGIGPAATSGGTFANAEHPRTFVPHDCVPHVSPAQSLVVGPHRATTGDAVVPGNEVGTVFVSGAASGALTPTGEVYN